MGVKECYREIGKSKKNGMEYQMLVIVFENGYVYKTFINDEQKFILKDIPIK